MTPTLQSYTATRVELVRTPARECAHVDLTARQEAILLILVTEPDKDHTVSSLAKRLDVNKPSIVRALDALAAAKLAERKPNPKDRRSIFARPTEAGRNLVARIAATLRIAGGRAAA